MIHSLLQNKNESGKIRSQANRISIAVAPMEKSWFKQN